MLGAPFSPWYARARATSGTEADPLRYSAFNVAVHGRGGAVWSLQETARVERGGDDVRIGSSALSRRGAILDLQIDGPCHGGGRVRGRCRVEALSWGEEDAPLDAGGRHRWRPVAPVARVEVELDPPRARWSGWGYVDTNAGDEPLERAFRGWTWSRAHLARRESAVSYEAHALDGSRTRIARRFEADGRAVPIDLASHGITPSRWGLSRTTRADAGTRPRVVRSLADTPFYARALVDTTIAGQPTVAMHEALSLERFRAPWVRFLLPFRIAREGGR